MNIQTFIAIYEGEGDNYRVQKDCEENSLLAEASVESIEEDSLDLPDDPPLEPDN
jgi:hypothetical protein